MRLVIFPIACVRRLRNGDTTQLKRELRKYQDVGGILLLRSLSTHWFFSSCRDSRDIVRDDNPFFHYVSCHYIISSLDELALRGVLPTRLLSILNHEQYLPLEVVRSGPLRPILRFVCGDYGKLAPNLVFGNNYEHPSHIFHTRVQRPLDYNLPEDEVDDIETESLTG